MSGTNAAAAVTLTADEERVILHALGLNYSPKYSYRNYYTADPSSQAFAIWEALEARGLAERLERPLKSDQVFCVTLSGAAAVGFDFLLNRPIKDAKITRKRNARNVCGKMSGTNPAAAVTLTADEKDVILHALGLNCRPKHSYRNYYSTEPNSKAFATWEALEVRGLAGRLTPQLSSDILFYVTRSGAAAVGFDLKLNRPIKTARITRQRAERRR